MKKSQKNIDLSLETLRPIADFIARLLNKTFITPNQITIFNFVVFVPLILYSLLRGTYVGGLFALFFIFCHVIFDLIDGSLARVKSLESEFGQWLDSSLDKIFQYLLLSTIIIKIVQNTGDMKWMVIGLTMLVGQGMVDSMVVRYDNEFSLGSSSVAEKFNAKFSNLKRVPIFDIFLKNVIIHLNMIHIFFFCCRYLIILGILFNRLDIFLLIFSITNNSRWIIMFLLYLRYLSNKESKLYTIKFLIELHKEKERKQYL